MLEGIFHLLYLGIVTFIHLSTHTIALPSSAYTVLTLHVGRKLLSL